MQLLRCTFSQINMMILTLDELGTVYKIIDECTVADSLVLKSSHRNVQIFLLKTWKMSIFPPLSDYDNKSE